MLSYAISSERRPAVSALSLSELYKMSAWTIASAGTVRSSFVSSILRGSVPGLADLPPPVRIMFVCGGAATEGRGVPGPGRPTAVWTPPLSYSVLPFHFAVWSRATSGYGRYCAWREFGGGILMKCRTSSAHFKRRRGQQRPVFTSNTREGFVAEL